MLSRIHGDLQKWDHQCAPKPKLCPGAPARTVAYERLGIPPEVIDALGRAYNRALFLEQRRELMTKWADYCDRLRTGAHVIPLQQRSG